MLMKRDEGGENRPSREELEGMSFDDLTAGLADGTITRAKAIKLAGAALLGGALTVLWADEADARNKKKRRRRKRRRRKAQVTPNPVPALLPGLLSLVITNPDPLRPLTISGIQFLDGAGNIISTEPLVGGPVEIAEGGANAPVQVNLDVNDPLLDAEGLRLIDERGLAVEILKDGVNTGTVIPVEVDL